MRVQCDKKTCRWTGEKDLLTLIPNKEMDYVITIPTLSSLTPYLTSGLIQ